MKKQCLICLLLTLLISVPASAAKRSENIAIGKQYVLSPAANNPDCTDPGDTTQLTDGKATRTTKMQFWTQPGTVGWAGLRHASITVDLERIEPICGVSFNTAAGRAEVEWPAAILIFTSDDGKSFRKCGDLVTLDLQAHGSWPKGYSIRKLWTSALRTRGRFVRLVVVNYPHIFCDEIEVFRGSPELLQGEAGGTPVADMDRFFDGWQVQRRFENDSAAIGKAIDSASLPDLTVRKALRAELKIADAALQVSSVPGDDTFRAVLPYNEAHARLFQIQASLWKAQGLADLTYTVPATWDPVDLASPAKIGGKIEVHTMRGEYRAAAINLANASNRPIEVRLQVEGLPESPTPKYIEVCEVPWTDTLESQPVAAALLPAKHVGSAWHVTVLPGLVRQVWLTFHVQNVSPGDYTGKVTVASSGNASLQVPLRMRVYPLDFPSQTTLLLSGFDETNGNNRGVTQQNRKAFIEHLKSHFVNTPSATETAMMQCSIATDGTVKLDTRIMDAWLDDWPNAKRYCVFLGIGEYRGVKKPDFGGAKTGTAEFDRNVRNWISAWVRHLREKGVPPERLALLLHDELHEGSDIGPFLAWAKAIRAAEPKVVIWETLNYYDPANAPSSIFEACDVLCPNRATWLDVGRPLAKFYLDQQRKGRTLHLFACLGPARLLDPYSYYRLQAWHSSQIGATGSFFWGFSDSRAPSSWNEYLAPCSTFTPLFLDATTVTAGKQMEAIREGVEDYEYLVQLKGAILRAKAANRSDAVLSQAESLLATAATEVLTMPGASELRWHTAKDRTKADALRIRILETLSALNH